MLEGSAAPCRMAPCSLARILISPMVVFVLFLISLSYMPLVLWYDRTAAWAFAHLALFHLLIALLLMSYMMTVCVDPGAPPTWWLERQNQMGNPSGLRTCAKSHMLKPPRSHYCSVTRRLVLNMDHFCPWVDNAVGYYNRKFFILFIVYACVTCLYAAAMLYAGGALNLADQSRLESLGASTVRLMAMMIDVALGIALIFFAFFHLGMAAKNETTIESCGMADTKYDMGAAANLEQVFGRNKWLWLLPIYGSGPVGDGINWPERDSEVGDGAPDESGRVLVNNGSAVRGGGGGWQSDDDDSV